MSRRIALPVLLGAGFVLMLGAAARAEPVELPPATAEAESAVAGKVVVVKMIGHGETFRFEPATVRVRRGDVVRFVHTGEMLHNVQFVEGEVPPGANLRDYWMSPFLPDDDRKHYDLQIDGRFLVGRYAFVCLPHDPWGMRGEIFVEAAPK